MSEEDRRRFQGVGGYRKLPRNMGLQDIAAAYPELLRKPEPLEQIYGPYIVTASRADRPEEVKAAGGGVYPFGPFATETEAQQFAARVEAHLDWNLEEVPVLNNPEVFGTGDERL